MPSLQDLGPDLLTVSRARLVATLSAPFLAMGAYVLFAALGWWLLAVLSIMGLSFVTYGSTSHDLVHRTLRLPLCVNDALLSLIELLSLRSGTAYRLSHLHHHRHLLAEDDLEGTAAHGTLWQALASGPPMQLRLWWWAWRRHPAARPRLAVEAADVLLLVAAAVFAADWSVAPILYVALAITGSWVFPLVTAYIPHDGRGGSALARTRVFRGRLVQWIALDHLYHLEHHLYPAVPHHHWKTLAARLDPHFLVLGLLPRASRTRSRKSRQDSR